MGFMGHTPGPWIWDEPSNWCGLMARVCTEKHEPIAHVQVSGWKKKQAIETAKLIAASPDLLAACKLSQSTMRRQFVDGNAPDSWGDDEHAAFTALSAAIARAEGTK